MKTICREYARNAPRDFLTRGALSLPLLASSQLAVALMFRHAHQLRIYPFGALSGVNGVEHWEDDVFKSLLGKLAPAIVLGAACVLVALGRAANDWRPLALGGLSFVCALILFGVLLVRFSD